MKATFKHLFVGATIFMLSCLLTACNDQLPPADESISSDGGIVSNEPIASVAPDEDFADDKPAIPENVAEGIDDLYDFRFSERYDDGVTDDFSLILPSGDTIFLFEKYQNTMVSISETSYDGDGMVPHMYNRYWYAFETGDSLVVETDFYEPDDVEYVSYVWTDVEGAKTNQNVSVFPRLSFSFREVLLCPYGIITTNRKTLY